MPLHVFFGMSSGLSGTIVVPKGTYRRVMDNVELVERKLGLVKDEPYRDNPVRWSWESKKFEGIDDKELCKMVLWHNDWVRRFYGDMEEWSKLRKKTEWKVEYEDLTPEMAKDFWHGLELLDVPLHRWSRDYYVAEMEHYYEVMRGRGSRGVSWREGVGELTPEQANMVIWMFHELMDSHDVRLEVINGRDYLSSGDDGGYEWCVECGAITWENGVSCEKKWKDCDFKKERFEEEE